MSLVSGFRFSISMNVKVARFPSLFLMFYSLGVVTARQRSCGNIMFSQVSVFPQGGRGWVSLVPCPFLGWYVWSHVTSRRGGKRCVCPEEYHMGPPPHPPRTCDTTGHGRQAGGTHNIGMLSCYHIQLIRTFPFSCEN